MRLEQLEQEFFTCLLVEENKSPKTIQGYKKDFRVFKKFLAGRGLEGNTSLQQIDACILGEYIQYINRRLGYKPSTTRRHVAALKSFFKFLHHFEYINDNPAEKLSSPPLPKKHPSFLYPQEVEKLFAAVEPAAFSSLRDLTIFKTLYYTGIRVEELVNLAREDLCLEKQTFTVKRGKGATYRQLPLHPILAGQLLNYLEKWNCTGGHLFYNRQLNPLSTEYIRQTLAFYAHKAGLTKSVTPHMLRHTFATSLYKQGVDLYTLSRLLGHKSLRNTCIYIHSDLSHLREGVEKLPHPAINKIAIRRLI